MDFLKRLLNPQTLTARSEGVIPADHRISDMRSPEQSYLLNSPELPEFYECCEFIDQIDQDGYLYGIMACAKFT